MRTLRNVKYVDVNGNYKVSIKLDLTCAITFKSSLLLCNKNDCTTAEFFLFMYVIQHCFICRPSDSTVSEDVWMEPRTTATSDALTIRLDLIHE